MPTSMRGYADLWVVVLPVHLASSAFAEDVTGPVVGVIGDDSIRVRYEDRVEELRRNGIDCPEKGQAYGKKTKHAAFVCGIKQGRPDLVDPVLFTYLLQLAFPEAREPEADQP